MPKTKSERLISAAGREVKAKEPAAVGRARRKGGAEKALAVKRAIILSKARRAGARIPRRRSGSTTLTRR